MEYRAWWGLKCRGKTNLSVEDWIATYGRRPSERHFFKDGKWALRPRNQRKHPIQFKLPKEVQERIGQQIREEQAAADAWLKEHEEEVPKVLAYMLDGPRFVLYDEGLRMAARWCGIDGRQGEKTW